MSSSHMALNAAPRQADVARWRKRSQTVRVLRIALPVLIGLIFVSLAGSVAYNTLAGGSTQPKESDGPIRLMNPRFVGRDDKGRAFTITANSAVRDQNDYQRVILDHPALVLDTEGPDPTRVTGRNGLYQEGDRKLALSGGVHVAGAKGAFDTADSLYDTRTGELVGSGAIQGSGPLGEVNAKSYGVYGKGERMVFKGGVHTRLDRK